MNNELRQPNLCNVVVSSRVRLARNYADIPFSLKMNSDLAEETINRAGKASIAATLDHDFELLRMEALNVNERSKLVEHHLISYDLLKFTNVSAVLLSRNRELSIMINEEDHLRIQGLKRGMDLQGAAEIAFAAERWLEAQHPYAFDSNLGYLTSCPTNVGTGMRASTMLHLPALSKTRQIGSVVRAISRLGLTVRGLYGEGSDAVGDLYQLSNQVTLGRSEADMIKSIIAATKQVVDHEEKVREQIRKDNGCALEDKLMRSIGILSQARILSVGEFMQLMSDLRVAASMGYIAVPLAKIDRIVDDYQSGSIRVLCGPDADDSRCDQERARLVRDEIKHLNIG